MFYLPFLLCLTLYLKANSKYLPPGGLYLEGRFNWGFFTLRFCGAYIWRVLYMGGLIFGILCYLYIVHAGSKYNIVLVIFKLCLRHLNVQLCCEINVALFPNKSICHQDDDVIIDVLCKKFQVPHEVAIKKCTCRMVWLQMQLFTLYLNNEVCDNGVWSMLMEINIIGTMYWLLTKTFQFLKMNCGGYSRSYFNFFNLRSHTRRM